MKRLLHQEEQEFQESKKIKTDTSSSNEVTLLSDLNRDEWSVIVQFLPIGSILMMALTSKSNHEWITNHVKNCLCKYYIEDHKERYHDEKGIRGEWSLANALRQKKRICLGYSNMEQIENYMIEIAARNGSICELSNGITYFSDFPSLYDLFDIRKGSEENRIEIQVETACIDLPNESLPSRHTDSNSSERKTKTIKGEPVGYELKNLNLHMTLNRAKMYKLLSKMKNLETLSLRIDQEYFRYNTGRGKGGRGLMSTTTNDDDEIVDESEEAFNEKFAYVPVMYNLKTLTIEKGFDNDNFIFDLLSICPNLENLDFVCNEHVNDELLEELCKSCLKLKQLTVKSYDGSTQIELEITDEGLAKFLEKQKFIESIDLEPAAQISGAIFKKLGDFPTLKRFRTQRTCYEGDISDQEPDLFFGGTPNPNLTFLDIGPSFDFSNAEESEKFLTSMKQFAPNLKGWGDLGNIEVETEKLVKLYHDTLETIELRTETLQFFSKCVNLKSVCEFSDVTGSPSELISNPNVTKLVYQDIVNLPTMSKLFPNLRQIESHGSIIIIKFLMENKEVWPQLVHLKLPYKPDLVTYSNVLSQRPHLFIDFGEYCTEPESEQVFCYKWLELDSEQQDE